MGSILSALDTKEYLSEYVQRGKIIEIKQIIAPSNDHCLYYRKETRKNVVLFMLIARRVRNCIGRAHKIHFVAHIKRLHSIALWWFILHSPFVWLLVVKLKRNGSNSPRIASIHGHLYDVFAHNKNPISRNDKGAYNGHSTCSIVRFSGRSVPARIAHRRDLFCCTPRIEIEYI